LDPIKIAFINVTSKCNLNCLYCFYKIEPSRKVEDRLTTECIEEMLHSLKVARFSEISFTGGEPLLRRDIFRCIFTAHNLGLLTSLDSNATLINKDVAEKLKQSGLGTIFVSLDDVKGFAHNAIRGNHAKVLEAIKRLKNVGIRIFISSTITRMNFRFVIDLCNFSEEIGAGIVFQPVFIPYNHPLYDRLSLQRLSSEEWQILAKQLLYFGDRYDVKDYAKLFISYYQRNGCRPPTCLMGKLGIVIDSDGSVYPCFHRRDLLSGNVLNEELGVILNRMPNFYKKTRHAECFGEHCISLFCPANL